MDRRARLRSAGTRRARALPLVLVAGLPWLLGACSHPAPAHVTGLTGLGATSSNWDAVHQATGSGGSTYGPMVDTGVGSMPTFSGVTRSSGHVAGWVMAFPAGTRLASAEHGVDGDLPADTQQTASSRQVPHAGAGSCEVVSYQSLQLRLVFVGNPVLGSGRFSVSFFDVEPNGSISTSYAQVNRAVVAAAASVPSPSCP